MNKVKALFAWILKDKRRLIATVIILILAIIGYFRFGRKTQAPQYQTATVTKGTIVSSISASGNALTTSALPISTQVSGIVKKIYVKDGDKVSVGQKIADITPDSSGQQNYAQALASFFSAQNNVASANSTVYSLQSSEFAANQKFVNDAAMRGLSNTDPTYIQEYADWKAAEAKYIQQQTVISQAQASLTNASINLRESSPTITAPYTGTISNINLVEGMVITNTSTTSSTGATTVSSQRVATIENQSTPIISVTLSEIDVPDIKVGQKATITFDSISDKTFTGTVATVDKIGSVSSNVTSYSANIKLDNVSDQILPNMAATASIITATKDNVLMVPTAAVKTVSGTKTVQVLKNGKASSVTVETGLSSSSEIEIVNGLSEGDTVITSTSTSTSTRSGGNSSSPFGGGGFGGGAVFRRVGG